MYRTRQKAALARNPHAKILSNASTEKLAAEGAITPDALAALGALKAAGLPVIAVTGRPVGWSEPFALDWPVGRHRR